MWPNSIESWSLEGQIKQVWLYKQWRFGYPETSLNQTTVCFIKFFLVYILFSGCWRLYLHPVFIKQDLLWENPQQILLLPYGLSALGMCQDEFPPFMHFYIFLPICIFKHCDVCSCKVSLKSIKRFWSRCTYKLCG